MKDPSPEELMALADGELSPARRREVEEWLARSGERGPFEAVAQISDFVRAHADLVSRDVDVAEQVLDRIQREMAPVPIVSGKRRFGPTFGTGLGVVLAAAAGIAFWLRTVGPQDQHPAAVEHVRVPSGPSGGLASLDYEAARAEELTEDPGAAILSVDFGASNGSIFLVNAGTDVTPVVWLLDETTESRARMEPL